MLWFLNRMVTTFLYYFIQTDSGVVGPISETPLFSLPGTVMSLVLGCVCVCILSVCLSLWDWGEVGLKETGNGQTINPGGIGECFVYILV